MNDNVSIAVAKEIMGNNFIGADELRQIEALKFRIPDVLPKFEFPAEELEEKKSYYLLILGLSEFEDGSPVTIRSLIKIFGKNPDMEEPCFYNQDWYEKEDFIDLQMKNQWFLIKKEVFEDSRAMQPNEL